MIIELAGVSGVGKSTVMRALIGIMRQNGLSGMSLNRVARRAPLSAEEAKQRCEARYAPLFEVIRDGHAGQCATLRNMAEAWECATSVEGDMIAVADEGFAHRLAYICAELTPAHFDAAFALVPRPAHLFVLQADTATTTARSIERRLPAAQAAAATERAALAPLHDAATYLLGRAIDQTDPEDAWGIDASRAPRRTAAAIMAKVIEARS